MPRPFLPAARFLPAIVLLQVLLGTSSWGAVTLPLEAIGPDGTVATATIQAPQGASATTLWLRVHGLTFQEKASVQVNGSAWFPLRNDNSSLTIAQPGRGYGGVGGVFQTLSMSLALPAGTAIDGANTVRLRLNQTDGVSISVRVLAFNLRNAGGTDLIDAGQFMAEDPGTWQPPRPAQADIDAGDVLWSEAALVERPGGPVINARCNMCHEHEGRDLKYFNYSNRSIIERSKFHGLSQTQAEQIASYIRTRPIIAPGRPWNPPYQPGPGLDAKPAAEWSAGAGLEWVVEDEHRTLAHLPGRGTDKSAHIDANHNLLTYNRREIPVPLQFFDWNHWLPVVHPVDSVGQAAWDASLTKTRYDNIRRGLAGERDMTRDQYIRGPMRGEIDYWGGPEANSGLTVPDSPPPTGQDGAQTQAAFTATHGILLNTLVRMWGLSHEYGLFELGRQFYGSQGEGRMFLTNRMVFNATPHIIHHNRDNDVRLVIDRSHAGDLLDWDGVTDAWYEMQTILNGGARNSFKGGHHDVDWKYNWYFVSANAGYRYFPILGLTMSWKSMQELDGGYGPEGSRAGSVDDSSWWGFNLRDGRPALGHLLERDWGPGWSQAEKRELLTPLYAAWAEKVATFPAAQWTHVSVNEFNKPRTYIWGSSNTDESYPDTLRSEITALRTLGVPAAVVIATADHGRYLWPGNDWDGLKPARSGSLPAPTGLTATSGAGRVTLRWNAVPGATSYNLLRADTVDGVYQGVALLLPSTRTVDNLLEAGATCHYRVSANQGAAVSPDSDSVAATVGTGLVLHWGFEEASGDRVEDATGGQLWGSLISAPVRSAGRVGRGLLLSGQSSSASNSFASASQNLNRWTGRSLTFTAWVKTAGGGTSDDFTCPGLMGTWKDSPVGGEEEYWMYLGGLDAGGRLTAKYWNGSRVTSSRSITDDAWHHVAITREEGSGAIAFYVDGAAAGGGSSGTGTRNARAFGIGRIDVTDIGNWWEMYRYWPGAIDEVRIYNTVLSASAISELAADTAPVQPTPGDANRDGVVDRSDLTLIVNGFGTSTTVPAWDARGDLNVDGRIDALDVTVVTRVLAP